MIHQEQEQNQQQSLLLVHRSYQSKQTLGTSTTTTRTSRSVKRIIIGIVRGCGCGFGCSIDYCCKSNIVVILIALLFCYNYILSTCIVVSNNHNHLTMNTSMYRKQQQQFVVMAFQQIQLPAVATRRIKNRIVDEYKMIVKNTPYNYQQQHQQQCRRYQSQSMQLKFQLIEPSFLSDVHKLSTPSFASSTFSFYNSISRRRNRLYSSSSNSNSNNSIQPDNDINQQQQQQQLPNKKSNNDQNAASLSRPSFRNPKHSPDDSQSAVSSSSSTSSSNNNSNNNNQILLKWNQLGLWTELISCLENEMLLKNGPTIVQQMVIPTLLRIPPLQPTLPISTTTISSTSTSTSTTSNTNDSNKKSINTSASTNSNNSNSNSINRHVAFLSATGSGKTLAYCLPIMQLLKQEEVFHSNPTTTTSTITPDLQQQYRPKQRPRAIILAPTRELCLQITSVCKQLSHSIKLSVLALTGGDGIGIQRQRIQSKSIDIIVATPGRLLQHVNDNTIILNNKHLRYIVLDEMDTMIEQGFAYDIQHLLYPVLYHKKPSATIPINIDIDLVDNAPSIIMTSATLTQSIQKMIGETQKDLFVNAKKHYTKVSSNDMKGDISEQNQQQQMKLLPMILPNMKIIKAPGLHRTIPRLQQIFVDVGSNDKITLLMDIISNHYDKLLLISSKNTNQQNTNNSNKPKINTNNSNSNNKNNKDNATDRKLTMIFCNTAKSCQAVEFALKEGNYDNVLSYHGELNSAIRIDNLNQFRYGTSSSPTTNTEDQLTSSSSSSSSTMSSNSAILVCTDLAARGLDIPSVDHVIMFDFPLNALDYLHRSGRTARGGSLTGKVTALVTKRDQVLANAISYAVQNGDPLDGLSSRKSDYLPGGRLNIGTTTGTRTSSGTSKRFRPRTTLLSKDGKKRFGSSSNQSFTKSNTSTSSRNGTGNTKSYGMSKDKRSAKVKPIDTTMRKQRAR